jgi:hypothetical protein
MADFFRPEAKALIWRFRDVWGALSVLGLGIWWAITGLGFVQWLGFAIAALGAMLLVAGVQRGRFRQGSDGPGIVQITERRLAYCGPLDGGVMDINDLSRLSFDPTGHPAPYWILTGPEEGDIAIPTTATGAEALFDAFSSLPGIQTEKMLGVLSDPPEHRVVIWLRPVHLLQ